MPLMTGMPWGTHKEPRKIRNHAERNRQFLMNLWGLHFVTRTVLLHTRAFSGLLLSVNSAVSHLSNEGDEGGISMVIVDTHMEALDCINFLVLKTVHEVHVITS